MNKNKLLGVVAIFCGFSLPLSAQTEVIENNIFADANFLTAVIVGLLLAFGFQFLLTTLSVALGIAAVGDVKKTYVEQKYSTNNDEDGEDSNSSMNTGVMITSAFGIWNVLTISIALFGATWLALQLSPVDSFEVSLTLGLVIWATFFMLMFYLEGRMVSSAIGSLISTVLSGLRASGGAIKSVFTTSSSQQTQQVIEDTIKTVRKELSSVDTNGINNTVEKFLNKVDRKVPSYEKLKQDILEIANEASANSNNGRQGSSAAKWTAIQTAVQTAVENSEQLAKGTEQGQNKLSQLSSLIEDVKQEYDKGNSTKESLSKVASKVSSLEESEAASYIQQVLDTIDSATPNDFDSGKIQKQLASLTSNPSRITDSLQQQLQQLDRDRIVDTLSKNTSLEKQQLNNYADQVELTLAELRGKAIGAVDAATDQENWKKWGRSMESSIANFINSTDNDELDYSLLKNDFKRILNNPKDSLSIVKHRLSTFDRDTLVSVITNNERINRSDINRIADQAESARKEVMQQVKSI
ncbi:MAG: hypothetical protein AAF738_03005, partial [Bacteroidota bacterium]